MVRRQLISASMADLLHQLVMMVSRMEMKQELTAGALEMLVQLATTAFRMAMKQVLTAVALALTTVAVAAVLTKSSTAIILIADGEFGTMVVRIVVEVREMQLMPIAVIAVYACATTPAHLP